MRYARIALLLGTLLPSAGQAGTYANSAHGDSSQGVAKRTSGDGIAYAVGSCGHCHDQHASRDALTHAPEDALRGLSEEGLCLECHDGTPPAGSTATDNIATLVAKSYSHNVANFSGLHSVSLSAEIGQGGSPFQGVKRHVECCDCHDPHTIGDTESNHAPQSNLIAGSDPLQGVWGVEPVGEMAWTPATAFTDTNPATKEYQICFKCHSYYALQDANGITSFSGPSGTLITDQAMEFAKENRSVHPVRVGLNNQSGSVLPNALVSSQLGAKWQAPGNQTMYCSDCHGPENGADPAGPHGSANIFMLKGEAANNYAFWPTDNATGNGSYFTLKRIVDNSNNDQEKILCKKCHPLFDNNGPYKQKVTAAGQNGGFYNAVHDQHYATHFATDYGGFAAATPGDVPCIACHTPIPHGSRRGRLIGYNSDQDPYLITINGDTFPVISGFKKPAITPGAGDGTTGYDTVNCYIDASICGAHGNAGGYDP